MIEYSEPGGATLGKVKVEAATFCINQRSSDFYCTAYVRTLLICCTMFIDKALHCDHYKFISNELCGQVMQIYVLAVS